jgi:hypothetical protein
MQTLVKLLVASAIPLAVFIAPLPGAAQGEKPYAGLQERPVKALSEQQIAELRAGRGMTLALAAELNGYPGPTHVLENAEALRLTPQQQDVTKSLREAMKNEAVPLGKRLIQQEAMLDQLFATKTITPANLAAATQAIALTQGSLRQTHLKYHLAMMEVLSPDQISHYRELRGYASQGDPMQFHKHAPSTK